MAVQRDGDPVIESYTDALGATRTSPRWMVDRARSVGDEPRRGRFSDVTRIRAGAPSGELAGARLVLEDGAEVVLSDVVPADLPFGYHRVDRGGEVLVLHAPAHVPTASRGWVLAAQLYGVRSATSWGHGDLADARRLAQWVQAAGPGGHLMLNPLHAPIPGPHPQPSPYFASTRAFRNPMYVSIDDLPGVTPNDFTAERSQLDRVNSSPRIDRDEVWRLKRSALAQVWIRESDRDEVKSEVDRWLGDPVQARYASFCVDAERSGGVPPSRASTAPDDDQCRFHAWLQVVLAEQLADVGGRVIHDVAVGSDRSGADAWLWPECFVLDGSRIGCPPDQFNTQGQDWGLPPVHPGGLRAAGYEPFIRAVRTACQGAAGIRIDHVMGLERLFWIPAEAGPRDGVYVRYHLDELLDVVAIEAHRAGAFVVGEDLGTVPPSIPKALAERRMLSYRIMSLDPEPPETFPEATMAALTTHDLATTVGLLTGGDLEDQNRLGLSPNEADTEAAVDRLLGWVGRRRSDGVAATVAALHQRLAESPARLTVATLDDLAGAADRPNMPGTIDAWPNWSIPLPDPLESVLSSPLANTIRATMAARVTS